MRVLHWFPNYRRGGGVANAVTGLARAQIEEGIDVGIAAVDEQVTPLYGSQDVPEGVKLLTWEPAWSREIGRILIRKPSSQSFADLRSWRPDVVHVHAEFSPDNLWTTRIFGCPLVLSFHGALHPEVFRKSKRVAKQAYVQVARQLLYQKVTCFHALSPAEAAHIEAVIPGRPTVVAPLGPAYDGGRTGKRGGCRKHGRGIDVLFVGRLDRYTKGLDLLVAAFAQAKEAAGDDIGSLVLVGPDWRGGRAEIERQVTDLGLEDSVLLPGAVPGKDVNRFIASSGLYVQLSRHDAFPLSVVDALVAGLPAVISSAVGTTSYREISSLSHVRVVSPNVEDAAVAMAGLATRYDEVLQHAHKAQERVHEFFSWRRIARTLVNAYRMPAQVE